MAEDKYRPGMPVWYSPERGYTDPYTYPVELGMPIPTNDNTTDDEKTKNKTNNNMTNDDNKTNKKMNKNEKEAGNKNEKEA